MAIVRKTLEEIENLVIDEAALKRLDDIKDEDIDYSDMPALTADDWARAMTAAQFKEYRKRLKADGKT